ncbi:MAG: hypothetical protein ACOY45_02255 [Pseudomonadota bacterium]
MIAALLLLAAVQDAPAAADESDEEIVVRASFGRATMLFDRGADGKLRNCRIMVSTGSARRDREACKAVPVCYKPTEDEVVECTDVKVEEPLPALRPGAAETAAEGKGGAPSTFTLPQLVAPRSAPKPVATGPVALTGGEEDDPNRLGTLPPPPKAPTDGPAVQFTGGQATEEKPW